MQATRGSERGRHFALLALGVSVPVLGLMLQTIGHDRIAFSWLPDHPLPHLCLSRAVFDFECPACGLTRSIVHLMHGRLAESFAAHRLGWLALLLFGILIAGRLFAGWRGKRAVYLYLWGFAFLCLAYFGARYVLEELLNRSWS